MLVAMNTILQVLVDALLGTFHLWIFPAWLGFDAQIVRFSFGEIALLRIWDVTSLQALAGVISPLIEVPVLVALVSVSLWLKPRLLSDVTAERLRRLEDLVPALQRALEMVASGCTVLLDVGETLMPA